MDWKKDDFLISDDRARLDLEAVHAYLSRSYWAAGISRTKVARSIEHSLCFGLYHRGVQIGFARVLSDFTHIAYLADVYILEEFRKRGLSKWLIECVLAHPDLQGLRRWMLATRDAHGLYRQYGFEPLSEPERFMVLNPQYDLST